MTTTGASGNTEAEPPEDRQAQRGAPARSVVSAARRIPRAILPRAPSWPRANIGGSGMKEIVTAEDVQSVPPGGEMPAATGAIVTPWAREMAASRGVRIVHGPARTDGQVVALGADHGGVALQEGIKNPLTPPGSPVPYLPPFPPPPRAYPHNPP